jgi:hydroxyacylglutathione hydrolase
MSLKFEVFVLGPLENNTILLWDDKTRQAVVIDPSFDPGKVADCIRENNLSVVGIWLTHAHFDHISGIPDIIATFGKDIQIWVHQNDLSMYKSQGMAALFGVKIPELPQEVSVFSEGMAMSIGDNFVEIRETPGHCQGHVIFYAEAISTAFTGDLIFKQGVGRTDLPGSNPDDLLRSINSCVLTLPEETVLIPGHGDNTTVGEEVEFNPYLN